MAPASQSCSENSLRWWIWEPSGEWEAVSKLEFLQRRQLVKDVTTASNLPQGETRGLQAQSLLPGQCSSLWLNKIQTSRGNRLCWREWGSLPALSRSHRLVNLRGLLCSILTAHKLSPGITGLAPDS